MTMRFFREGTLTSLGSREARFDNALTETINDL
jgi:hypothetical protein